VVQLGKEIGKVSDCIYFNFSLFTFHLLMDQVSQIREKIDIASFISEYIPLKKAGKNFQALCPFHGEKTPSFVVSSDRQIWHCFGCGKGGDIYTFLMEFEHMEFPEALRFLAKQAGIELIASYADTASSAKKEILYKVNSLAAEFYHYILTKHAAGKSAMVYLQERGINEKLIETFKIGYAPSGGRSLVRYLLQKKGYKKEDIVDSGLATAYSSGISDFFRERLMFPLIDHRDNILGFSGRLLDEKKGFGGKYINTRDTLIYHKREHFFGLNITKEAIRKANQAILVEGEFDVMSCFQNGISNVIAVKGTALTEQQVNLLSRYAEKVTVCFDGDSAGQEAIKRSLPLLSKKGLNTTVIVIPSGKDPDEALRIHPGEFKRAAEHDSSVYDYLFEQAMRKYSPATPEGKRRIADEFLPVINDIDNAIVKEHYIRKLGSGIKTTYENIVRELDKKESKAATNITVTTPRIQKSREEMLEEYLLALMLQSDDPKKSALFVWEIIAAYHSAARAYQKVLQFLVDFYSQTEEASLDKFSISLPAELLEAYNTATLFPIPSFTDRDKHMLESEKVANQLKILYVKEKIEQLAGQIKLKEQEGNEDEVEGLKKKYSELATLLNENKRRI
jgi:DNA primase